MIKTALWLTMVMFTVSAHAQYAGNNTFHEIINTAKSGIQAADRIATVLNDSLHLVPGAIDKLDAIEKRMKSIENSLNSISSPAYIVGIAASAVTVSVSIVGFFFVVRHLVNRHNCFGAAEPYVSPTRPGVNLASFGSDLSIPLAITPSNLR